VPEDSLTIFVGGRGVSPTPAVSGLSGTGGDSGSCFIEKRAKRVKNLQGAAPIGSGKIVISW